MAANGNSGNSTGQSAASAQAAAAAGNAAASNAANSGNSGNTSSTSGESAAKGQAASGNANASNNANDAKGEASKGNSEASNDATNASGLKAPSQDYSKGYDYSDQKGISALFNLGNKISAEASKNYAEQARNEVPSEVVSKADEAYTKARAEGKTEEEAQQAARNVYGANVSLGSFLKSRSALDFKAKNTGPTYNPATTAMSNVNPTIAAGSSKMGPSNAPSANNAPGGNIGGETGGTESGTESAAPSVSDASNTGVTYRGGTVTNGGTSVTDSGTGGSISSSVTPPSRDASSIGLGVYNTDRANYDQDNWNRGMEAESSSLVSDEECKAFAKRAFMENSEPFKKVRISIIKKC